MSRCCHGSSGSNKGDDRFKWWGIAGFALILVLLWAFDGNPWASQLTPLVLLGLMLIWLVVVAIRRMGVGR